MVHESREGRVSRRSLVAGGLATAVAAVTLPDASAEAAPATTAARPARELAYVLTSPSHVGLRTKGSATLSHARLLDHDGVELGTLRASGVHSGTGGVGALRGNLTTQVLELGHDTLVGVGIGHHQTLDGAYAIVAGTGKYVGASGSYTIRDGSVHVSLLGS